jgi:hypothetical protein
LYQKVYVTILILVHSALNCLNYNTFQHYIGNLQEDCFQFIDFAKLLFRYKFDDERVTKEDMNRALEEQYGGEEEVISIWKH